MQIDHYPEHVQDVIDAVFTKGVESSAELRHAVFAYATAAGCTTEPTAAVPAEWQPYLDKVIHRVPHHDRETADLQRQGHSEEAIVELTVLAALGAGVARLEQGLAALQKVKGGALMRLTILTEKLSWAQRLQLRLIKGMIGHEVGPIAMQSYHPDFFGRPFNECVAEALRGTTFWTKAEAELFAAFVLSAKMAVVIAAVHTVRLQCTASPQRLLTVLTDWRTAPVRAQIRATLAFLEKLTAMPQTVNAADIYKLYEMDITEQGVREAIYICFIFCTINRLADAFDFEIPNAASYRRLGFTLYKMGYGLAVLPG